MALGQLDMIRKKIETQLLVLHKNKSWMGQGHKHKPQHLLEENIGENLLDLGVGEDFFQVTKAPNIQGKKLINWFSSKSKFPFHQKTPLT